MNKWEKKRINDNLTALVEGTRVDTSFLTFLVKNNVLSRADVELINSKSGEIEKSYTLYDLIITRTNGYSMLLKSLEATKQVGILKLLAGAGQEGESSSNATGQRDDIGGNGEDSLKRHLIIGDCSIGEIMLTIMGAQAFCRLGTRWKEIAHTMGTPCSLTQSLAQEQNEEPTPFSWTLEQLIVDWMSRQPGKATVQELINIFKMNNMNPVAHAIEAKFVK